MFSLFTIYVVTFAAAGVACLGGLLGVRTLNHPDVRRGLGGLLLLSGAWSLLTAVQFLTGPLSVKRAIYTLALTVGISTVFAWLYFASAYSGRQYHRNRTLRLVGLAILGSIVLIKLTNPIHGGYFHAEIAAEPFRHAQIDHFTVHWFVTGFSYTAASVGFWWLFESFSAADSRPTHLYLLVGVTALPIVPYVVSYYTDGYLLYVNYEPLGVAVFALGVLFHARTEFARLSSPDRSYIADSISEGVIVVDDDGHVINYNDSAAAILGDLGEPRLRLEAIEADLADLEPGETTILTRTVDGGVRRFEVERVPLADAPMAAAAITLTDVSRVAHLEEITRLYREISEALVRGTDPDALKRRVVEKLTGIDAYRVVWLYSSAGRGCVSGDPEGYVDRCLSERDRDEPVLKAARTGRRQLVAVDDAEDWATAAVERGFTECLAIPLSPAGDGTDVLGIYTTDPDGFSSAEVALFTEIGESLPHAISAIRAHSEASEYREAITQAGYAVYITDVDGTIRHVNPAFEEITGYPAEEAVGRTPAILNSGEMDEEYYERLWEAILDGEVFEEEIVNKTRDGDRYLARQTVAPVTDESGEPVAFVAIQIDITNRHVREQRLTVLNRILRHNLRNEMNLIAGSAELVEDVLESLPESGEREVVAAESAATIQELAEEIVSRSKKAREIEQVLDRTRFSSDPVSVADVVERVRQALESSDVDGSISLHGTVGERWVDGEVVRVLDELVENAVAHNDGSEPEIDVEVGATDDGEVCFAVTDNGPGLSEQELAVLSEGEETQLRHGSGLGLWMVNWLVVYCGGSVTVEVDGCEGTSVEILVPPREPETTSPEPVR